MYTLWSVAIVICLILVFFSLIFSSCAHGGTAEETEKPGEASGAPTQSTETSEPTPTEPPETELGETPDAGQEYIDRMIFLGDSTTNGLREYGVLSDGKNTTQVWTPSSGTLTLSFQSTATIVYPDDGTEITIVEAVTRKQPDVLVITLGVNGVSFMDEQSFKSEYKALVESIQRASPNTKIICNSIYPVENDYIYIADINNENIPRANGWIYDVAVETGTHYTDSASVLKNADGSLNESYGNGDGIHLCADGYNRVLDYLRTHAWN